MEVAFNIIFESDDEEIDVQNLRVRRPRFIRDRLEHFTDMDDHDFVRRFRFTKRGCLQVLELIEDRLEYPSDKLVLFLHLFWLIVIHLGSFLLKFRFLFYF